MPSNSHHQSSNQSNVCVLDHQILEFLEAIPKQRSNTPVIDITVHRPVSPSSEQCLFAVTPRGTIRKRADGSLSADQRDQLDPKAKEAYARLFRALVNGVNLIKVMNGTRVMDGRLSFYLILINLHPFVNPALPRKGLI